MKKLIIIAAIAFSALGITEVKAQYAERIASSLYIDVQDMPTGSWSNSSLNTQHHEKSATNSLYKRLQISSSDEVGTMTWNVASTICNTNLGAGWRLPTHREALIYAMSDPLSLVGASLPIS